MGYLGTGCGVRVPVLGTAVPPPRTPVTDLASAGRSAPWPGPSLVTAGPLPELKLLAQPSTRIGD